MLDPRLRQFFGDSFFARVEALSPKLQEEADDAFNFFAEDLVNGVFDAMLPQLNEKCLAILAVFESRYAAEIERKKQEEERINAQKQEVRDELLARERYREEWRAPKVVEDADADEDFLEQDEEIDDDDESASDDSADVDGEYHYGSVETFDDDEVATISDGELDDDTATNNSIRIYEGFSYGSPILTLVGNHVFEGVSLRGSPLYTIRGSSIFEGASGSGSPIATLSGGRVFRGSSSMGSPIATLAGDKAFAGAAVSGSVLVTASERSVAALLAGVVHVLM